MTRLLCIFIVICLCGGCGFKDIDRRFFVVALGIDKSNQPDMKYEITLKLAIPGNNLDLGSAKYEVISQDANSITEAVRFLKSKVDKELDFGHAKVIIFGQSFLKEYGINQMDWLNRRRDIQLVSWVAAGQPSAKDVLSTQISHERLPGNSLLLSFGNTGVESGYVVSEYLFDFYRKKKEWGLDPILPIVQSTSNQYIINKAIVFDKENAKLTISADESRLFNIMNATINKVELESVGGEENFFVSVDNIKSKFRVYTPKDAPPYVDMNIRLRGVIEESALGSLDPHQVATYEKEVSEFTEAKIKHLLEKFQKANLDPMGFGLDYRAHHFGSVDEEWRTWQGLYPELEFRVNIQMKLEGVGIVK
ncbi:Ger(x)C family spore germination protein [Paenibacillus sp. GCM10023248]|uniref:Ger(x)C family spore germination protein n=1 Tax=Bacillales TaxID=1385 RepID=UPI0023783974|nr:MULTISPECIES: Ger(x)C family spore germination protein [Bacillales]MDD9270094.1 Ger(x)C family spore germination protein [Paenibacillus sp. MAHUQ-63]MDR6880230.1 spore germination protein KC [Bacillus sp. 3255]